MLHAARDAPAIARVNIVLLGPDAEADVPLDEVTGLLMRMRMHR
jgi:hypothetical protein